MSVDRNSETGEIDKVYLVFHSAEKSVSSIQNSLKNSHPALNLTTPSKIECKELDKFLQD